MLKEFLKKELSGWNKCEKTAIFIILAIITFNSIVLKDNLICVISAICGSMYTIIAGKGKISCYMFGLAGSGLYAYLSFINGLYGNCALYLAYYIPMQIAGIFQWKKHLKKSTNEIIKSKISKKELVNVSVFCTILCAVFACLLFCFNDSNPVLDSVSTILSVLGMYFTVRRYIEQWIIWGIVNLIGIILWVNIVLSGAKTYSTVLMWSFYFVLAIYFYIQWRKELVHEKCANNFE